MIQPHLGILGLKNAHKTIFEPKHSSVGPLLEYDYPGSYFYKARLFCEIEKFTYLIVCL